MSQDMRYVKEITLGGINVKKIEDINGRQLWPYDQTALNYFYFEGIEDGTEIGVQQSNGGSAQLTARFWVSNNKTSWTQWGYHSFPVQTINRGEKLYIWNKENTMTNVQFTTSKNVKCGGNIMSLLNWREDLYAACFMYLFALTKITTPPELPVTIMTNQCYWGMFDGCTELTAMPALPATTLADYCYQSMFSGCTKLTVVQDLPATTLAEACYMYMFSYCNSLTTTPRIYATTLDVISCYRMFYSCEGLTSATDLFATTLAANCCGEMFAYCRALRTVNRTMLPATNLAGGCYHSMFKECNSLTTAPDLNAINLASGCYSNMFDGCTSLNYVFAMFTTDISNTDDYTNNWLRNVAPTGNFTKNRDATWNRLDDPSGIPVGWTVWTAYPYVTATLFLQSDDCDLGKVNIQSGPDVCNEQKVALLGDVVPIKAVPNVGVNFVQWSDGDTNAERNITMLQDVNLTAFFNAYAFKRLDVNSYNCSYGKIAIGINSYSCSQYDYIPNNTYMTIKATPEVSTYTYFFGHWSDGDMSNPKSVYMDDNKTLTAYFSKEGTPANFRVVSNDETQGAVRLAESTYSDGWVRSLTFTGSSYEIAAQPFENCTFDRWLFNGTYMTGNPINVVLTDTRNIAYAYFIGQPEQKTLYVNSANCDAGKVIISNDVVPGCSKERSTYNSINVTIEAIPETSYTFEYWSDGDTQAQRTIVLDDNKRYDAYFSDAEKYFCVKAEDTTTRIWIDFNNSVDISLIDMYFSYDKNTWTKLHFTEVSPRSSSRKKAAWVWPNGTGRTVYLWNKSNTLGTTSSNVCIYAWENGSGGNIQLSGNIMSLLNWGPLYDYCFANMFVGCAVTDISNLLLPATELAYGCYLGMFKLNPLNNSGVPELPAVTLKPNCYVSMFAESNLSVAPALPALTLAEYCYYNMFYKCRITQAPALPARKLRRYCYANMFQDCTRLTTAPDLPALNLATGCYSVMFGNCTNLNYIKAMFVTDISTNNNYTTSWLYGTSVTGTFVKNVNATWIRADADGTNGWTIETANP